MDLANLIHMANRIGDFFEPQPNRADALAGIADHLKKFWDPRMRRELLAAIDAGQAAELHPVVAEAIAAHRGRLQPAAAH
jgi:formate dehydrogenase subunit delta